MSSSKGGSGELSPRDHVEKIRRDRFFIGREEKNPLAEDMHQAVNYLSEELYSKDVHFLMELIQNAEDNQYPSGVAPSLEFVLTSEDITATGANSTLVIFNNEEGFSAANVESICRVGKSTKKGQRYRGCIGEKGIGFKSVFLVSSQPHIFSNGYQIRFNEEPSPECDIGYIVPEWFDEHPTLSDLKKIYGSTNALPTTTIVLPLKATKIPAVRKQLSSMHPELLLFLSKIRKLSIKEIGDNNTKQKALTEVSISSEKDYQTRKNVDAESYALHLDAEQAGNEEQCTYYMWKQKFPVKSEYRVKKREEVDQWTITLAFPHGQRLSGAHAPGIYAFLPTEMVTNFPFIIQADFLLASSRETILFDSPWNKGILECVPSAFINAFAALVKTTSDAPAFSLPPKFKFLPIHASPLQLIDSVRLSIKKKILEEHIIPSQSYNKQKIFCKPGEVRRLNSQFWDILDKAQKLGVDLQSISSHGHYILCSCFDTKEYDDVLEFLGIGYMDWGWYPKCIKGCDLVKEVPEEVYMMLLHFAAEHWLLCYPGTPYLQEYRYRVLTGYGYDSGTAPVRTGYATWRTVSGTACINRVTQRGLRLCIASDESLISWLISWNRELACPSDIFFMPLDTQRSLKGFCKRATVMDWLQRYGKMEVFTAYKYGSAVSGVVNERRLAIVYANFVFHLWQKGYISEGYIKGLCASMPIVDNYGSVVTRRSQVLVPAKGSKWVGLMGSNPWRSENYVELSGDYRKSGSFASNYTPQNALMIFIQNNVGAADVPYILPPNASFLTVTSPLTKENTLLLLDWIRNLRSGGVALPSKFLDSVKSGSWLKTSIGYKPPKDSFLSTETWGSLLQIGSDMVDIPMIDQEFYGKVLSTYKNELQLIGVIFEFGQASEMIGKHLMSRAANEAVKKDGWLKTCLGNRSPSEAFLFSSEWTAASCIANLPFIDDKYYGQSIFGYKLELELLVLDVQFYGSVVIRSYSEELRKLGVAVQSKQVSKVMSLKFKQLVSSSSIAKDKVLLLLKSYRQLRQKQSMFPADLLSCMKDEKWLQTKMGLRAPVDSVLFNSDWDSISSLAIVPFIEYSSDMEEYKDELRALGVAITLKQGAGFVLKGINLPTDPTTMTLNSSLHLLKCIKYWKENKTDLPKEFRDGIRKKWLRTVLGYRCPDESLFYDSKHSSLIHRGDGPSIDEEFYGSEVVLYKEQLKGIGVTVDMRYGCSIVARHLICHSERSTIVRIYKFLKAFEWEPENKTFSWIWVPGEDVAGEWVFPENCVLHDNSNLFASELHILDKFYEEDLLGFFSTAFNVKDEPDIENYVKLWKLWEKIQLPRFLWRIAWLSGNLLECTGTLFVRSYWPSMSRNYLS
ncbi:hypothetical protein LUZ63_002599 [Rhynchospora breviuscula]|uniref:Sacsin/Nov domain-containing protein n=1 Tax=Rhynchospora breviuscula TaxID=2022672 RepID=A0A9Q0CZ43_9POAL|nr:hypothetical protein LUZ63_002599 [Rhynchospora breviuscula]